MNTSRQIVMRKKPLVLASLAMLAMLAAWASLHTPATAQQDVEKSAEKLEMLKAGDTAPDFTLKTLDGKEIKLSKLVEDRTVALIMLRGFPGYQCPICTRQVGDVIANAKDFDEQNTTVLFVYPGPSQYLDEKAKEFAAFQEEAWPAHTILVTDPDYKMVNAYRLRWDAPRETAYPATLIIGKDRKIQYAKISESHAGRTKAAEVVAKLKELNDAPAQPAETE